jgi:hypothetical protein
MATFAAWLTAQSGRQDPVGAVASLWVQHEGSRPKVHSPKGIENWLVSDVDRAGYRGALRVAVDEYNGQRALAAVPDHLMPKPDKLEEIIQRLSVIEHKLDALAAHEGMDLAEGVSQLDPVDWNGLAAVAEWGAQDEAAG